MLHAFSRTEMLIDKDGLEKLSKSKIAIFGVGGVGSFVVEGLVRAGVGRFVLVDDDCVCLTNLNRQLHATRKTIGKPKVEVMKERILEINPKASVETIQKFYLPQCADEMISSDYDYIVDAIDTVTAKIDLVLQAQSRNIPIISSMGTGNKMNPMELTIADIYETSICPLAKVMRKELRARNVKSLKVLYSKEVPIKPIESEDNSCATGCVCPSSATRKCTVRHQIPGSISFVPSVAGLIIASEIVKDIIGWEEKRQ